MTTKKGKIVFEHDRFMIEAEGVKQELPVGPLTDVAELKQLAGKDVELVFSTPQPFIVAINTHIPKIPHILCYVPPEPWIFERFSAVTTPEVRDKLAAAFLDKKVITQAVHEKISIARR